MEQGRKIRIDGLNDTEYPKIVKAIADMGALFSNIKRIKVKRTRYNKNLKWYVKSGLDSITFSEWAIKFVSDMKQEEINAIIAHELSHISNKDTYRFLVVFAVFFSPVLLLSLSPLIIIYGQGIPYVFETAIVIAWAAITFIPLHNYGLDIVLSVAFALIGLRVLTWVSRKCEERCDREAIIKVNDSELFKTALQNFYKGTSTSDTLSEQVINWFIDKFEWIFGKLHPTLNERLAYADYVRDNILNKAIEQKILAK